MLIINFFSKKNRRVTQQLQTPTGPHGFETSREIRWITLLFKFQRSTVFFIIQFVRVSTFHQNAQQSTIKNLIKKKRKRKKNNN